VLFFNPQIVNIWAIVPHTAAKNMSNKLKRLMESQNIIQGIIKPVEDIIP
jgi:hypothetical protein